MAFYEALGYSILHPKQYKNNPLYGRNGMELMHECPNEALLLEMIKTPLYLGHVSSRQANRMTIIACNAGMEYDFRVNGISNCKISEQTQERIVKTGIKLLKKDLPIRPKVIIDLYTRMIVQLGLSDLM